MWPKALIELLPHLTRLVPVVNRYFQSKSDNDDATRIALERKLDDVSAALRRDLGKDISEASAALPTADISRQLAEHREALADVASGIRVLQSQSDALATRLTVQEKRNATLATLVASSLVLTLVICVLLIVVLVRLHR